MLTIRQSCFETNSSSTHSLIIYHEDYDCNYTYKGKEFVVSGEYYGRSAPIILSTFQDKLNYIWTAIINLFTSFSWENEVGNSISWKQLPTLSFTDEFYYWREKCQELVPSAKFIVPNDYFSVTIDHAEELKPFFEQCKENLNILKDLLYEDNSFIIVEGDEGCMVISAFYPDYWTKEQKFTVLNEYYQIYVKGN